MVNSTISRQLIILFFVISTQPVASSEPLVFVQTHLGNKFQCAHQALEKAYRQLGLDISIQTYPAKRALKMANNGIVDGEMLRVKGIELDFPNLLRIPVPLCSVISTLVVKNEVNANNWDDLKKYRFGTVVGFPYQKKTIEKYGLTTVEVTKNDKLIELLLVDRVDAIFLSQKQSSDLIHNNAKRAFKTLKNFNREVNFYHYLHKKHIALVPLITQELRLMESAGKLDLQAHHQ